MDKLSLKENKNKNKNKIEFLENEINSHYYGESKFDKC